MILNMIYITKLPKYAVGAFFFAKYHACACYPHQQGVIDWSCRGQFRYWMSSFLLTLRLLSGLISLLVPSGSTIATRRYSPGAM